MKYIELKYASEIERDDILIVKNAVRYDPTEFIHASERLWNDPDMISFVKNQCKKFNNEKIRFLENMLTKKEEELLQENGLENE